MAELKTQRNDGNVESFLDRVEDGQKRKDSLELLGLMREVTGRVPEMWGESIVGFGTYHYRYESGREGDWFLTGFSPRKQALTVYIMPGLQRYGPLLEKLGRHKTGKSCLYIRRLADIDMAVLRELVTLSVEQLRRERDC